MALPSATRVGIGGGVAATAVLFAWLLAPATTTRSAKPPPRCPSMPVEAIATPSSTEERFYYLDVRAREASATGDLATASVLATESLAMAPQFRGNWNYGNALHRGHTILGLAALARGDVAGARQHLAASADVPGSPQLDSFGPSMALAQALADRGERAAVIAFLARCARFWKDDFGALQRWTAALVLGQAPDFAPNRCY